MFSPTSPRTGLISALFLGVLFSSALAVISHYHTWVVFIITTILQSGITFLWWHVHARKNGTLIRVPYALWLCVVLGGDVLFMTLQGFTRVVITIGLGLFAALAYWLWFERYEFAPEYQRRYLQGWYRTLTTCGFFFWNSSLFALFVFLSIPVWLTSVIIGAMGALFVVLVLYAPKRLYGLDQPGKHMTRDVFWLSITIGLVFFQLVWTLHFLPLGFLVNAFTMTIIYLLILTVVDASLNERTFSKSERALLLALGALFVAGLASARWI